MGAHRHGELDQHVHRSHPRLAGVEPQQRRQQLRTIRKRGGVLVHQLHVVSFEDGDVEVLAGLRAPMVLHHQEARLHHFQHEAHHRDRLRGAPDAQLAVDGPDAQVDAGTLDDRRQLGQRGGEQRQRPLEDERLLVLLRRHVGERDLRDRILPRAGGWPRTRRRSARGSRLRRAPRRRRRSERTAARCRAK